MFKLHVAGRLAACAFVWSCLHGAAQAHDYAAGALRITHPWSRPTPPSAPTAVGYLSIANTAKTADRLVSGSTPAADKLELHTMSMAGGVMVMRPVPGGLAIPAGASLDLTPGGYHLMLIGPKQPFKPGARIPVTLVFEHAGTIRIELDVEPPTAGGGGMPGMDMPSHMDMH